MRLRSWILPWTVAGLLIVGSARADSPAAEAEVLISRGLELREKGKDDEALVLFRQAEQRAPSPRARAQVALAEQALGMWVSAEADLTVAMDSSLDPWITKNHGALERALAVIRKHIASLEVRGAEKADVFIDGHPLGTGAGPYRVEAGRRTLEVRAKGYQSTSRTVDLPAGGTARESVQLVLAPVAPNLTEPPPRAIVTDSGRGQRVLGWVFVGVGAALLATGGASLLVRKNYVDDYNSDPTCPGLGAKAQPPSCEDRVGSTRTWMTVAIISLIAGGASVVGGGVIIATSPSSKASGATKGRSPESGASVACGPFGCAGTF